MVAEELREIQFVILGFEVGSMFISEIKFPAETAIPCKRADLRAFTIDAAYSVGGFSLKLIAKLSLIRVTSASISPHGCSTSYHAICRPSLPRAFPEIMRISPASMELT